MADELRYDIEGYEILTNALIELLNGYPGLELHEEITFGVLDPESGKAMFPTVGAVIRNELEDVTGHVTQECMYPFSIVARSAGLSESRKIKIKEWLDGIGKWLEKQPVKVGNNFYKLDAYPTLTGNREFKKIERTSTSFMADTNADKAEDWVISISAIYTNEFERMD